MDPFELPRQYNRITPDVSITETATQKRPSRVFRDLRGKGLRPTKQQLLAEQLRGEYDSEQEDILPGMSLLQGARTIDHLSDGEMM